MPSKKELLILILAVIIGLTAFFVHGCYGDPLHYVYIALEDKVSGPEGTQSMKGDIVDIRPINETTHPSGKSLLGYAIIKVHGLTEQDIIDLKEIEFTDETKSNVKWYRKRKVKAEGMEGVESGLDPTVYEIQLFKNKIKIKDAGDYAQYQSKKAWHDNVKYWMGYLPAPRKAYALSTNISTINLPGEDYDTWELWEADTDNDLVTADVIEKGEMYDDDGDLVTNVVIAGATTDITRYRIMSVAAGERHDGVTSSSVGSTINNGGATGYPIRLNERYAVVEWLRITNWNIRHGIDCQSAGDDVTIRNLLIYDATPTGGSGGIFTNNNTGNTVYNCIISGLSTNHASNMYAVKMTRGNSFDLTIFDIINTGAGLGVGIGEGTISSPPILKNNLVTDTDGDYVGTFRATSEYNLDEDGSAPGTNSQTDTAANLYENIGIGTENFHLKASANGSYEGVDLSGTFTIDIDDETRADWDKGADEFISVGPTPTQTQTPTITATITPTPNPAAVEMIWDVGGGENDYIGATAIEQWEDDTDENYTLFSTVVYSHSGITGSLSHGDAVTGKTTGATGTIAGVVTSTQILIVGVFGTFASGEQIYETIDTNYVVISNSGNACIAVAEGYAATEQAVDLNISGATTSVGEGRIIRAATGEEHNAIQDTTQGFRITSSGAPGAKIHTIHILEDNFTLQNVRCHTFEHNGILIEDALNVLIDKCIIHNGDNAMLLANEPSGIDVEGTNSGNINNCFVFNINSDNGARHSTGIDPGNLTVNSCTVYNITNSVTPASAYGYHDSSESDVINSIAIDASGDDFFDENGGGWGPSSDYNMSGDNTIAGSNGLTNKTAANNFTDLTANQVDLHLIFGADALDTGLTVLTEDIELDPRPINVIDDRGGDEALVFPTQTPTQTQTATQTQTFTQTQTQTQTMTITATQTVTATQTQTVTATQTTTQTLTVSPTQTTTSTPTQTQTLTPIPTVNCRRHEKYTAYFEECQQLKATYVECETYEAVYVECETYEAFYYFGSQ